MVFLFSSQIIIFIIIIIIVVVVVVVVKWLCTICEKNITTNKILPYNFTIYCL